MGKICFLFGFTGWKTGEEGGHGKFRSRHSFLMDVSFSLGIHGGFGVLGASSGCFPAAAAAMERDGRKEEGKRLGCVTRQFS